MVSKLTSFWFTKGTRQGENNFGTSNGKIRRKNHIVSFTIHDSFIIGYTAIDMKKEGKIT